MCTPEGYFSNALRAENSSVQKQGKTNKQTKKLEAELSPVAL